MAHSRPVYIRFELKNAPEGNSGAEGIFIAAYSLRSRGNLTQYQRELLEELLNWFKQNLTVPDSFNRSKSKGYYRRETRGLSWLKPTAKLHLSKFRELVAIVVECGHEVSQVTTNLPGYVVYEDNHQIVAEPFTDLKTT